MCNDGCWVEACEFSDVIHCLHLRFDIVYCTGSDYIIGGVGIKGLACVFLFIYLYVEQNSTIYFNTGSEIKNPVTFYFIYLFVACLCSLLT